METPRITSLQTTPGTFAERVGVELNRAERYRVFVSLTVLDLGAVREVAGEDASRILDRLIETVNSSIRACDFAALLEGHCLALLFPETPRQGAEIASRRLAGIIRSKLEELTGQKTGGLIPVEIVSYPDTAGAKTLNHFLEDLVRRSRN